MEFSCRYISRELQRPENEWSNPFTSNFLGNPSLLPNEKLLLASEVFAGGIDAVRTIIVIF